MTIDANHPLANAGAPLSLVRSAADRAKAFRLAQRHSRLVRILKVMLPLFAVGVLGLYFVSSKVTVSLGDLEASISGVKISRERLRMINPRLENVNKDDGVYVMTANWAEQETSNPTTLFLDTVRAELTEKEGGWSRMAAPKGTFYTKKDELYLYGGITTTTSSGMVAKLKTATVYTKTNRIRSEEPVDVQFLNGNVKALTMEAMTEKQLVFFRGNVRVHIRERPEGQSADGAKLNDKPKAAAQ